MRSEQRDLSVSCRWSSNPWHPLRSPLSLQPERRILLTPSIMGGGYLREGSEEGSRIWKVLGSLINVLRYTTSVLACIQLDTTSSPPRRRRSGVTRTMEVSLLSPRVTTHLLDSQKSVRYSRHSNSKDLINLELEYTIVVGHRFSYLFSYLVCIRRRLGLPVPTWPMCTHPEKLYGIIVK